MLIPQTGPKTIADGLLTSLGEPDLAGHPRPGRARYHGARRGNRGAMRLTWERAKLLIEPSAAVAWQRCCPRNFETLDGLCRVGVILSGGNADLDRLPW